jgi:hypothetical protein
MDSFTTWDSYICYKAQTSDISWVQYIRPVFFNGQYWRIINTTQGPDKDVLRKMNDGKIGKRYIQMRKSSIRQQ